MTDFPMLDSLLANNTATATPPPAIPLGPTGSNPVPGIVSPPAQPQGQPTNLLPPSMQGTSPTDTSGSTLSTILGNPAAVSNAVAPDPTHQHQSILGALGHLIGLGNQQPGAPDPGVAGATGLFHHGALAMGHPLGNILGWLGDAMLVGAGQKPQYAPRLDAMRQAAALQGHINDPAGASLAAAGFPTQGTDLDNQNASNADTATNTALSIRQQQLSEQAAVGQQARNVLATAKDQTSYTALRSKVLAAHPELANEIPEDYAGGQDYVGSAVPAAERFKENQQNQRVKDEIAGRLADSNVVANATTRRMVQSKAIPQAVAPPQAKPQSEKEKTEDYYAVKIRNNQMSPQDWAAYHQMNGHYVPQPKAANDKGRMVNGIYVPSS